MFLKIKIITIIILILFVYTLFKKKPPLPRYKDNFFISIGKACDVKYNIDDFAGSKETFFFDWLMTDMASVNKIVGTDKIDSILFFENIIQNPKDPIKHGKSSIIIKSLSFCESIHDIPVSYDSSDINNFIEKYKRRYNRIVKTISDKKAVIYFIRKGKITRGEKKLFIKNILNINSKCQFKLVELLEQKTKNNYFISEKYFISVNLDNYRIKTVRDSWISDCWNWRQIFSDISK